MPALGQEYVLKQKVYRIEDGLANANINFILEDSQGFMWFAHQNGWMKFDGNTFENHTSNNGQNITRLAEDPHGRIWAYHSASSYFHTQAAAISIIDPYSTQGKSITQVFDTLPFRIGDVQEIKSLDGTVVIDLSTDGKRKYLYDKEGFKLLDDSFYTKNEGQDKTFKSAFHYYLNKDIREISQKRDYSQKVLHTLVSFAKLSADQGSPSRNTFLLKDTTGGEVKVDITTDASPYPSTTIYTTVGVSANELVWIRGERCVIANQLVKNHFSESKHLDKPVRAITKSGEELLWCNEGLIYHKGHTHFVKNFDVISIYPYANGHRMRLGGFNGTLLVDTLSSFTSEVDTAIPEVWTFHRDRDDRLWVGGKGLGYLSDNEGSIHLFENYNAHKDLKKAIIYHFQQTGQGFWLATSRGLYLIDASKGVIRHVYDEGEDKDYIPFNHIVHIHEDEQGWFWLASQGGGLLKWHPEQGFDRQYTTKDGFPNDVIYEVYQDDFGYLWMGSNQGLIRFHKASGLVHVYTEEDGITNNEFNRGAHYEGKDGTLYFGGLKGITIFHPKDFIGNAETGAPPIRLTGMQKHLASGATMSIADESIPAKKVILSPDDPGFTVRFSLLDYIEQDKVRYSYKIEGIDADWIPLKEPHVRINKLPYGTHQVRLRGKSPKSDWTRPLTIEVKVLRPFYLQTWFIFLAGLTLTLSIVYGLRHRVRSLKRAERDLKLKVASKTVELRRQAKELIRDKKMIEKQAAELKTLDQAKSRFFANISHEFRTPLTLIMGPLEKLIQKQNKFSDPELTEHLALMKRNSRQLQGLVDDILDLSKLSFNKLVLQERPVVIKAFLEIIFTNYISLSKRLNIEYTSSFDDLEHQYVKLDVPKLEQVLNNLLSNAFKYTQKGGTVKFEVTREPGFICFAVSDTGQGISPEELPYIFDRFYQGRPAENSLQSGTGIGLSLVRELVKLMGGEISVSSYPLKGSRFSFRLPLKPAEINDTEYVEKIVDKKASETFDPGVTVDHAILIVEDNTDMQRFILSLLQPYYSCLLADNGREALEKIAHNTVDLVISDLMMPEMNGLELIEKLKTNDDYLAVPMIMLTALNDESTRIRALTIGVDDYLTKPFYPQELLVRVYNLLYRSIERRRWHGTDTEVINDSYGNTVNYAGLLSQDQLTLAVTKADISWLKEVEEIIRSELTNSDFLIPNLAEQFHLSNSQFARRIKKITGLTPKKYQQEIALQTAREMLEQGTCDKVTAVAYSVGINNIGRFSKLYEERFGKRPTAYFNS
ncbi:ATP-binding protein [Roseivirga sp. BDSF3-8]|uniref:hybrid sensor histidine kinase/response regulator transcription factor n=1 Tax=Roseivirga sp. BDSF3-8 TaxID=3241598 RepID=UPI0035323866